MHVFGGGAGIASRTFGLPRNHGPKNVSEKPKFAFNSNVRFCFRRSHGKALILDGIIQCTEFDEFAYQEMIAFLPLNIHPSPTNVLIVGGGDGGVAREVAKHPLVEKIVQVEIDAKVVDASKKHLPFMSCGFNSPKLSLKICDGFQYMHNHKNEFDVVITDSSDPIGPAENLFTESYFALLKQVLRPNGVICSQGGTHWVGLEHVAATVQHCKRYFDVVKYAVASVPTYPCGQIGFVVASLDAGAKLEEPVRRFSTVELKRMQLRYYNDDVHKAAFVLPNFAKEKLS